MQNFTKKDLLFLKLLAEYRVLLIQQIAAINNIGCRAARKKMNALYSKGLITASLRNFGQGKGRPENICLLSEKGVDILKEEGIIENNIPNDRILFKDLKKAEHELLINWFRIHLLHLEKHISDLSTEFISSTTPFLPLNKEDEPLISDKVIIDSQEHKFTPDGVFSIVSKEQKKRLLFFLEVDMSTETIVGSKDNPNTVVQKIRNYQTYLLNEKYKRYQKKWKCELNGFRLLFLTNTASRKETLSRLIRETSSTDFIWITDQEKMFQYSLSAKIWSTGGDAYSPVKSIIGPTLARELPLKIKP